MGYCILSRHVHGIRIAKMKKNCFFVLLLIVAVFTSCAYVDVKSPLDIDLDNTELGSKRGVAEAYSLFWLFAWGDASYAKAAENGNIKLIRHADQEVKQILLGFYTRWRVVVYGD